MSVTTPAAPFTDEPQVTAHTKGPWFAERVGDGKRTIVDAPSHSDRAEAICEIEHDDVTEASYAEAMANLRLILVAPALLAYVKALEAHCSVATGTTGAAHAAEGQALRERGRELIAKAEGAPASGRERVATQLTEKEGS